MRQHGSRSDAMRTFRYVCIVFIVVVSALSSGGQSDLVEPDQTALKEIARSFTSGLAGWDGPDPCAWKGVGCRGGRVTAIQVGGHGIGGTLSPYVSNLTALIRLELQSNYLSGPLPELGNLRDLQALFLHNNSFTSIPADGFFSGLTSLQSISLDQNPFAPWEIPQGITAAQNLVNLSANSANITGPLPEFLALDFTSLQRLDLAFNDISGPVPSAFGNATNLRFLWLNGQKSKLSGRIDFLSTMVSLQQVWLHSNNFSGPVPDFSQLINLWDLGLRDNYFTGPLPASLVELPKLNKVTLTNNLFQGPTPMFPKYVEVVDMFRGTNSFCLDEPGVSCNILVNVLLGVAKGFGYPKRFAENWKGNDPCAGQWLGVTCDSKGNITTINFSKMGLSGIITPEFKTISSLQVLDLSDNKISSTIPQELTQLTALKKLDVSNNELWGKIPEFTGVEVITTGNPKIGKDGPSSPPNPGTGGYAPGTGGNAPAPAIESGDGTSSTHRDASSVGIIVGSVIAGVAFVAVAAAFGYYLYRRKKKSSGRLQNPHVMSIHPQNSGSGVGMLKIAVSAASGGSSGGFSGTSSRPGDIHVVETGSMVISIQVLRDVTNNFSEENIIGRGGFGTVYKGELHDGTKIAVKRMESGVMGTKGLNEFKSEILVLTKVRHRNLVSLLGYCWDGNERILVYEFMPQGALSDHLFDKDLDNSKPLDWKRRLSIALDVARGVEYLHGLAHQSFIHRDLKPSNILLSDDLKAKVADFGLVRLAPSDGKCGSVETKLAGTFGYLAPEYAATGRVTTKADVYSYGVILMELITGRKALDERQPEESMHLVTWFRRMQLSKQTFRKAIDHTIDLDDESLVSISTAAELARHCCAREPHQRPDMGHVVNVLSRLVEVWKPADAPTDDVDAIDLEMSLPEALERWKAIENDSYVGGTTTSSLGSLDNSQTSIPMRPPGMEVSFTVGR